jgi:hypothetical protein
MGRQVFWITFAFLGLMADFVLPLWCALGATIPIFVFSWWLAYRSGSMVVDGSEAEQVAATEVRSQTSTKLSVLPVFTVTSGREQ